jgi:hypothetical protein
MGAPGQSAREDFWSGWGVRGGWTCAIDRFEATFRRLLESFFGHRVITIDRISVEMT